MKRLPGEIERESLAIIRAELKSRGIAMPEENALVILRCIHASADFDYAETLRFTQHAVSCGVQALLGGADIVTDTNMALSGISKSGLRKLGGDAYCFMADGRIAEAAKLGGTTRASASVDYAAEAFPHGVFAVGNAPTALFRLSEKIREGLRPSLVIGVPVGFVNVVESKECILQVCREAEVPAIVALGRKGGSSIAAAVCNALIYSAAGMLDPKDRGWD